MSIGSTDAIISLQLTPVSSSSPVSSSVADQAETTCKMLALRLGAVVPAGVILSP